MGTVPRGQRNSGESDSPEKLLEIAKNLLTSRKRYGIIGVQIERANGESDSDFQKNLKNLLTSRTECGIIKRDAKPKTPAVGPEKFSKKFEKRA